ncbi:hypothetical protein [Hyphococcus sp.]|uniref:hypothetical protein n=1 Tax=Hyphococcus sp. TaxID=2038636 RepID=UPI0035C6C62A
MAENHQHHSEEGWADKKGFRNAFLGVLIVASIAAAIAGFIPAFQKEHPHFAVEGWGVFFAVWGFAAFMFIVLAGQHLRKLVGRKEGYYEERE